MGIVTAITAIAAIPTGRLTKKIQRHEALSTMNPPISGPMIEAPAKTEPISPWYLPRSRGGTIIPTIASVSGKRPPAPTPWTARKMTSCIMFCARPQSAEPTRKIEIATMNSGLRPCASPSFPYSGTVTVEPST